MKLVNKLSAFVKNKKAEFILLIGLALVVFGGLLCLVFPMLLGMGLNMNFKLTEGKFIFDNWKELPVPLITKVYIFDIENPEEFSRGAVPVVKEKGPYVYKEYRNREVIEWSENEQKVKFMETLMFIHDPEMTTGSLEDRVTIVNVPLLLIFSIINAAVEMFPLTPVISPIVNNVVNTLLATHREGLIETRTAGEVINGRRIGLLDTIDIVAKPLRMLGLPIPEYGISAYKLRDNMYGFLAIRNNSQFGPFEMYTGSGDKERFNKYATYKERSRLGIYRDQSCDALNGTDGTFFGSYIDSSKPLYLFNIHACRSFRMDYAGDSSVNGVSTYRYEFGDDLFDGPTYNRQNWCFCPKKTDQKKCHGLLDLSQCLAGVPFAMTYPHFLNSPRFLSGVEGLNPNREKHLGYFELEPTLGITLKGSGRFQINLKLRPFSFVPGLNGFKPTLLPYLWIDEGAVVTGFLGYLIKAGSYSINGANYAFILTIFLGTGISLFASALMYKRRGESNKKISNERQIVDKNYNQLSDNQRKLRVNGLTDYDTNNRGNGYNQSLNGVSVVSDKPGYVNQQLYANPQNKIYPNLAQNQSINTVSQGVDIGIQRSGVDSRRMSEESQRSQKSVIGERHSSHSIHGEIVLPPLEDGETYTTVIIQRKPLPN